MSESLPWHRVLVRHGESEGDIRREAYARGEVFTMVKTVEEEEITPRGEEQSRLSGLWIQEHVIARHGLMAQRGFRSTVGFYASPTYRTAQSAVAMDVSDTWQSDIDLNERDRGKIKGWPKKRHEAEYPESYAMMKEDPLHWCPPGGESILGVAERARRFMEHVDDHFLAIIVGHRDWMWAAQMDIERLSEEQLSKVDTDAINNAQVIYYTNVNPDDGCIDPGVIWKRSACPWLGQDETSKINR